MVSYRIDDLALRDEPDDVEAAWARIRELEQLGAAGAGERVVWLRMLGELDAAEELGWQVLAAAGGPATIEAARHQPELDVCALGPALRLAHVLHWQGRFADADELFSAAIDSAERLRGRDASSASTTVLAMRAFGYQHLGKVRFDQGRHREALELFEAALAIREAMDAPGDQIASSRQAISAARHRLG